MELEDGVALRAVISRHGRQTIPALTRSVLGQLQEAGLQFTAARLEHPQHPRLCSPEISSILAELKATPLAGEGFVQVDFIIEGCLGSVKLLASTSSKTPERWRRKGWLMRMELGPYLQVGRLLELVRLLATLGAISLLAYSSSRGRAIVGYYSSMKELLTETLNLKVSLSSPRQKVKEAVSGPAVIDWLERGYRLEILQGGMMLVYRPGGAWDHPGGALGEFLLDRGLLRKDDPAPRALTVVRLDQALEPLDGGGSTRITLLGSIPTLVEAVGSGDIDQARRGVEALGKFVGMFRQQMIDANYHPLLDEEGVFYRPITGVGSEDLVYYREGLRLIRKEIVPALTQAAAPTPPDGLKQALLEALVTVGSRAVITDLKAWKPAPTVDSSSWKKELTRYCTRIEAAHIKDQMRALDLLWPLPEPGPAADIARGLTIVERLSRYHKHEHAKLREIVARLLGRVMDLARVTIKERDRAARGSDPQLELALGALRKMLPKPMLRMVMDSDPGVAATAADVVVLFQKTFHSNTVNRKLTELNQRGLPPSARAILRPLLS